VQPVWKEADQDPNGFQHRVSKELESISSVRFEEAWVAWGNQDLRVGVLDRYNDAVEAAKVWAREKFVDESWASDIDHQIACPIGGTMDDIWKVVKQGTDLYKKVATKENIAAARRAFSKAKGAVKRVATEKNLAKLQKAFAVARRTVGLDGTPAATKEMLAIARVEAPTTYAAYDQIQKGALAAGMTPQTAFRKGMSAFRSSEAAEAAIRDVSRAQAAKELQGKIAAVSGGPEVLKRRVIVEADVKASERAREMESRIADEAEDLGAPPVEEDKPKAGTGTGTGGVCMQPMYVMPMMMAPMMMMKGGKPWQMMSPTAQ